MLKIDHDNVIDIVQEAAATQIMPLWQNLADHEVMEKGRGDVVTEADHRCEEFLTSALEKLLPESMVVGEESFAADPGVIGALESERPVWVIDPLDGTRNFAKQSGPFAVMVCLMLGGETLAAWIYDPVAETLLSAEHGAGAWLGDQRMQMNDLSKPTEEMRGAVMVRYLPDELKEHALSVRDSFAAAFGTGCAGYDYRQLVTGAVDFLFYYSTLVWDHAPGVLILEEAGGCARRYGGESYRPKSDSVGLICAAGPDSWERVRDTLVLTTYH
jgi:fructose-1,6-bisphosphatase/inositol monophosphatase family enzyme